VKLKNTILRNLGTMSRSIQYINDLQFKCLNLQRGQFVFLTRICEDPGINMATLTHILKVDKATTTKAVQKLIEADFVSKTRNDSDKREFNLFPQKKALDIYSSLIAEENREIDSCFTGFSKAEQKLCCEFISRLKVNVEKDWEIHKQHKHSIG